MVHTLPDYTTKYRMVTVFGQIDTGELAARLGSIDTFDRRGNVIWMDDFEGSMLHWEGVAAGAGAGVSLSNSHSLYGDQSCKLTTANTSSATALIAQRLGYQTLSKIGFEFGITSSANLQDFIIAVTLTDGTYIMYPQLKYIHDDYKLYYSDHEGNWKELATTDGVYDSDYLFNKVKLVCDFKTRYYTRCILNDREYDMSSYMLRKYSNGQLPNMYIRIKITAGADANVTSYVDGVIITQNEV